jgi:hypothetical protein
MWNLWSVLVLILNEESFLNYIRQKPTLFHSFEYVFIQNIFNPRRLEFSLFLKRNGYKMKNLELSLSSPLSLSHASKGIFLSYFPARTQIISNNELYTYYLIDSLRYSLFLAQYIRHTCLQIVLLVWRVLSCLLPKKYTTSFLIVAVCLPFFCLLKSLTLTAD